jgi:hypothetical protein
MSLLLDNGIIDVVEFGRYWEETGMKNIPIQWLVLEETDEYLFLTTKETIISKFFDKVSSSWIDSDIRRWLNNDFINLAFNEYEKPSIIEKEIDTIFGEDVMRYKEKFCNNKVVTSEDKLFLLSIEEVEKHFSTQNSRIAEQGKYALNTLEEDRKFTNSWWLRNSGVGLFGESPILVLEDGMFYLEAAPLNLEGIRPAMFIKHNYYEFIPCENQLTFDL